MTRPEREQFLEAVYEAVMACPQLRTDPRLTPGQLHHAARQVRAVVARKTASQLSAITTPPADD